MASSVRICGALFCAATGLDDSVVDSSREDGMSFRNFADASGIEWQVFDVVPRSEERRHYDRRSADFDLALTDRRDADRRIAVAAGTLFQKAVAAGWLCFECRGERRRLAPIPDDWTRCSSQQLESYCRAARIVRTAARDRQ